MTIAVHISFSDTPHDPLKNFNYRCFTILAGRYPGHHFIFIFDKPFSPLLVTSENITPVLLAPAIRNRLLGHYWYNFKIPRLLNKYHADIFINNGINHSLRTTIKQCMIIKDLSFLQKENLFTAVDTRYLKKYFKKFIAGTACIAVTNQYTARALEQRFPQAKEKLHVVDHGLSDIAGDIGYSKTQAVKDKYAEGKEFFLAYITAVSASTTTTLLKAFSLFKKRQLSNMQLVLAVSSSQKEDPLKDLATYKYRNEVKIIERGPSELPPEIPASAYAAVYLPSMEVMEDEGLLVIKNNIPLITSANEFCESLYKEAALYTTVEEKSIAEKMMLVYKDENLRNDLVNNARILAANWSWEGTATGLWEALLYTTEQ